MHSEAVKKKESSKNVGKINICPPADDPCLCLLNTSDKILDKKSFKTAPITEVVGWVAYHRSKQEKVHYRSRVDQIAKEAISGSRNKKPILCSSHIRRLPTDTV